MAEIKNINGIRLLYDINRVFLPSRNINVFPCSRRGREELEDTVKQYDPEARLNTERTNRLHTAINGFADSFISSFDVDTGIFIFVLAGYYIEVKNFNPADIAGALNATNKIYAHLSLYNNVSLSAEGYFTEILYRQFAAATDSNYLDISYPATTPEDDFFVGVSFTAEEISDGVLPSHNLLLFTSSGDGSWKPVETSLLPKIEHGETENSIKLSGDFRVNHNEQVSFNVEQGIASTPTLKTNRVTSDLINVGALQNNELTNTSGNIVAKNNITALGSMGTRNDLTVDRQAHIKNGLIVGNDDTSSRLPAGEIKATVKVATPSLQVNTLTSDSDVVTITENLKVTGNTEVTEGNLIVKNGITTRLGNLNVSEGNINVTKGKITTLNLQATTEITTPTVKTNIITSDNTEIAIDKVLKVDAIESDSTNGLTVNRKLTASKGVIVPANYEVRTPKVRVDTLTSDGSAISIDDKAVIMSRDLSVLMKKSGSPKDAAAVATIDKAIIGDLVVQKDDTNLTKSTGKITTGSLAVGQYINVGSPAIPTTTAGDIVAKNSIFAENHIAAKNTIKAPALYQTVNGSDKPVPFIDLVEQDGGQWQLQISRVNRIEK